jgi:ADP-ribose pyrophosphatase YjhB (NUDIX family)
LIGGHLEDDESLVEGLCREMREETGLGESAAGLRCDERREQCV